MRKLEDNKYKKIQEIVSVVKLCSLLFSGIVLFKDVLSKRIVSDSKSSFYTSNSFATIIFALVLIYVVWAFSTIKRLNERYMTKMLSFENTIFMGIFTVIIVISGAHESQHKFIFLFIIITSTIQAGLRYGMIVAGASSTIILVMDLIMFHSGDANKYFENDLILAGVFILTAWPLGYYVKIEKDHIEKLENLANVDGLTGVYNHRCFYEKLREKIKLCEIENKPISMVFIDIDYFKYYNDLYGHQQGDEVLRSMGMLLKDSVREGDIVARYGGEEFAIILPETREIEAIEIAEAIRKKVEDTYFQGEENQPNGRITVSVGVSTYPEKAKDDIELIKSADDALYKAKFFSKNRVVTYTSILDDLKKDIEEKHIDLVTSIKTLISVINAKDKYTYGHVERVVIYSRLLAEKLNLNEEEKKNLIYGAYMHDIGKINIGKEVLNKKMPLTRDEWETLKQHPANGVEIIKPVNSLKAVAPLIMHHHERYDGSGYPDNLKGEDIPYLSRVLSVVDSFDAMTSNRPYNKRKTYEEGVEELRKFSGTQFDPYIAERFIEVIQENKFSFDNLVAIDERNKTKTAE